MSQKPPETETSEKTTLIALSKRRYFLVLLISSTLFFVVLGLLLQSQLAQSPIAMTLSSPTPHATMMAPTTRDCLTTIEQPCYSPVQIQKAFGLTSLYQKGFDGRGQTIVIIGAGGPATVEEDLKAFDQAWGLPDPPSLKIISLPGASLEVCTSGQREAGQENLLATQWAHAIAPGANLVLLLAPTTANCQPQSLLIPLEYALDQRLGHIITISYGSAEARDPDNIKGPSGRGHTLLERAAQEGITVLAALGDDGAAGAINRDPTGTGEKTLSLPWPGSDPLVLSVGGTTLQLQDESGTYGKEVAWNDEAIGGGATGGGLSTLYSQPAYQKQLPNQNRLHNKRAVPDVSFLAAPYYLLYGKYNKGMGKLQSKWDYWHQIGGNSTATPCWAGLIAIANQMNGKPLGLIHPLLYRLQGKGMHDITQGHNTFNGVQGYSAEVGYDLVTGWGTPIADQFLPALVQEAQKTV